MKQFENFQEELNGLLKNLKERPGVYIGKSDLGLLDAFFGGFEMAIYFYEKRKYNFVKTYFNSWLEKKYCTGKTVLNWSSLITNYEKKDEAFDQFFKLYDDFLSEYNKFISEETVFKFIYEKVHEIDIIKEKANAQREKSTKNSNRDWLELRITNIPCKYGSDKYERDYFEVEVLVFKEIIASEEVNDCFYLWNIFLVEKNLHEILVQVQKGNMAKYIDLVAWRKNNDLAID